MGQFWQQLIALILTPTLIIGAVAWIIRYLLNQGFKRDIEKFKAELQHESFEKRQKFSLIHQKRAEIIAEFYSKLANAKILISDLVAPFQRGGQSLSEKSQRVSDAYNETVHFFFQNKLFLPKSTAEKSEEVLEKLRHTLIDFETAQMGNDEYKPDDTGLWVQAHKSIKDEIPPILDELETEFKNILGVIEVKT